MSERRAKVARCSHGVIHSAHAYTVGDECAYCTGEPYARDLCRKHYRRLRRRGLLEVRL